MGYKFIMVCILVFKKIFYVAINIDLYGIGRGILILVIMVKKNCVLNSLYDKDW